MNAKFKDQSHHHQHEESKSIKGVCASGTYESYHGDTEKQKHVKALLRLCYTVVGGQIFVTRQPQEKEGEGRPRSTGSSAQSQRRSASAAKPFCAGIRALLSIMWVYLHRERHQHTHDGAFCDALARGARVSPRLRKSMPAH